MSRDKDSKTSVSYNEKDNFNASFQLTNSDCKSLTAGTDKSLNVLVATGARELHTCLFNIEPFKFKDNEGPSINNARFIAWKKRVNDYGFPANDGVDVTTAHNGYKSYWYFSSSFCH
jgi:hypothetical protein